MAHSDIVLEQLVELINHHGGIDAIGQAVGVLMNHAMVIERADALGAQPYQRTDQRRGHANGFKPKPCIPASATSPSRSPRSAAT